jgi:hypothetical protein
MNDKPLKTRIDRIIDGQPAELALKERSQLWQALYDMFAAGVKPGPVYNNVAQALELPVQTVRVRYGQWRWQTYRKPQETVIQSDGLTIDTCKGPVDSVAVEKALAGQPVGLNTAEKLAAYQCIAVRSAELSARSSRYEPENPWILRYATSQGLTYQQARNSYNKWRERHQ